jgi:Leucine-rich repeat (LRR) protein
MKKLYTLLVVALIGFAGNAQIVNIPDANFKAKLLLASPSNYIASTETPDASGNVTTYSQIDTNNDGEIQVSEALAIKWLYIIQSSIANLTGIESFTNLEFLACGDNQLTSLNVSGLSNLRFLSCNQNGLTSLNVSGLTNLQTLYCFNNQLPSLNVSGLTNLQWLDCNNNQLTSLNLSGLTNLQTLGCNVNQLTNLNVSGLTNLQILACSFNQLSNLNVSGLTNLQELYCHSNQLPSLNVSGLTNLQTLYCFNNQLPSLNVSGLTNLQTLDCSGNLLPSLNVSGLTNLQYLDCSYNYLPSLIVNGLTNLQILYCSNNQLTSLNIKNGVLENEIYFNYNPTLQYICADEGQLDSIQYYLTQYGYTNCNLNSYCSFTPGGAFYTIQGNNRYDSNSNGCDASDSNLPNFKCAITDGTTTGTFISNTSGSYTIPVQAGTHTVTPILENPTYFTVTSSNTGNIVFPTATSPYVRDFCVTPNGIKNDLEVTIIPIEVARPGFDAFYKIIYKNKGNQVANGSLSFTFNDAIMDLVTASPIVNTTGTNSLSWNYNNLNPLETREINLTFNINSPMETPAVNGGDVLNYGTTIVGATDETPNDNVFSLNQTVVNSYDPNDKTCLEGTTITPSMVGNYVHYVIRFENTGTFAAQNVVIKDIIDTTKFDISTLVPQSSSHPFVTRITNTNQVEFIFENINLPFNDATNDGYVAFKIKTLPSLVLGDTFTNSAGIYFDYNFPIVTNTTTTTVATLGNQDFDFGSVFTLSPVPAKDFLTITTKQDVVVSSVNIYNTLGQLVQVHTNPTETIDVSGLQSGSYFVRITSDKGSATGKFLKE